MTVVVVWRFRKERRVVVLEDIEDDARRMRREDVWRAELKSGCGRGGIVVD